MCLICVECLFGHVYVCDFVCVLCSYVCVFV